MRFMNVRREMWRIREPTIDDDIKKTFPKLLFNLKIQNLRRVLHNNNNNSGYVCVCAATAAAAVVCVLFRKSNYFNSIL